MTEYDFIMAGGGAAGLGLAYHLCQSPIQARKMLIIDRDNKEHNDRTWSFWTTRSTPYEHMVYHTWDHIEFIGDSFHKVYDLHPYRYQMIRGIDFYRGVRSALSTMPDVDFLQAKINGIEDTKTSAQVTANDQPYLGKWVFNSLFTPSDYIKGPAGHHYLMQHFKGWEIETNSDAFNPQVVTLFDFRTPQNGTMRFFYILPFSKRRALIEYTLFSANLLKGHEYELPITGPNRPKRV
jgi:lycopene beta-cyclase